MERLKPKEDAFGQELRAAYKGEEVFDVVERDDGLINVMKLAGYFSDYEAWSRLDKRL